MEDKRKYVRFNVSLDAKSKAAGWFKPRTRYLVKDVSKEGFKLNASGPLEEGNMLDLEISVPGKTPPIPATGQVVWNHRLKESGYDIGFRFKSINPGDRFDILDYAYNRWIQARKTA